MKKIKLLLAGIIALGAIVGCNKENNEVNSSLKGEETFVAFSIQVKGPAAVKSTDSGVAEESKVNDVKVFIFNGSVLEAKGDISIDSSNKGTKAIKTTLGRKTIVAVANKSTVDATIGSTLADFKKIQIAALQNDIAEANKFAMVGIVEANITEKWNSTEAVNPSNLVKVEVARLASKVQVQCNTNNSALCHPRVDATAPEVKWILGQQAKNSYLWQNNQFDQTCKEPSGKAGKFYNFVEQTFVNTEYSNFKPALLNYDGTYANSSYLAENVNAAPVAGNTSCIIIGAALKINNWADAEGNLTAANLAQPTTFYVLKLKGKKVFAGKTDGSLTKILYFQTKENATSYQNDKLGSESSNYEVLEYKNGQSYYRVNIHTKETELPKKYAVLRNTYYKSNISSIDDLGANSIDDLLPEDPDTPLEIETNISCEITIADWAVIENNESLS